mgnify:CR=1 FL=1
MKITLTATAAILARMGVPAYAQVSGIDTTTTAATDADIDVTAPNMEIGAEITVDGAPRPDDALDIEAQGDADIYDSETDSDIDPDASVPVNPTVETELRSEFEPEPDLDIDSALDLKINDK